MKQKRGQFYLIAAIILITIIIGFATISNYAKKKASTKTYDLGEELKIESAQVLDYGIYSEINEEQMRNLLVGFIETYSEYGEIERLYFIFGNSEKIIVMGYQELEGEISIELTSQGKSQLYLSEKTPSSKEFLFPGNKVIITINGSKYELNLKPKENFYFIIVQSIEGEQYVVTS